MTLWQSLCKYVCYDDDDDMIIITSAHEVYESAGTETFRIPLMFAGLQRYVHIPREGGRAGSRAELIGAVFNDVYRFNKTTYRPGGGETICPPPMAVRRWQKSRRIYVRLRTGPQSTHLWWLVVAKLQEASVRVA